MTEIKFKRLPEKSFIFERINIILGANGTGKSKILTEIRDRSDELFPARPVIYVEGGRTISLTNTLEVNRQNFQDYSTLEKTETTHKKKKKGALSQRTRDALMLLDRQGQHIKEKHSDEITNWIATGKEGQPPLRVQPPIQKLFELFSEVFPSIVLTLDSSRKTLSCSKNGSQPYPPSDLSDGEKQVLSILADIAILAEDNSLILVDEPELNLNPSLAGRLWETVENDLPECIFIYTTHDVGFSMRENVEKVLILSNENENISEIRNIKDIGPNELRLFLGSIPAILSTNSALITEGQADSFDPIIYRWLAGNRNTELVPMGSSSDVFAVANRQGVWQAIAPDVKIKGVIDRDFKSDKSLASLASEKVIVLELHEAESYLCLPEIIQHVSEQLGLRASVPNISEIKAAIKTEFDDQILKIAAQRVFDKATIKLSVSIQRSVLSTIKSIEDLEAKLLEESRSQASIAAEVLSEEKIKQMLKEEVDLLNKVSEQNDIKSMLKLMPGKSLLEKLYPLTGAKNKYDYARACTKFIEIASYPELKKLRDVIMQ